MSPSRTSSSARSSAAPSSRSRSPSRRPSARLILLPRPNKKRRRASSAPRARPRPPRLLVGPSRSAARASSRSGASTPRRRSRSRCRARAASRTCPRAARAAARTCSSGCRTAELCGDGVLGGAREFCSFSCGARFFLHALLGRFEGVARVASAFVAAALCCRHATSRAQYYERSFRAAQGLEAAQLGLKAQGQTSGS